MNGDNLLQQASSAHQAGRFQEAIDLYAAIIRATPDHPEANYRLGILAMQLNRPTTALPYLQKASRADAANEHYSSALAQTLLWLDRAEDALTGLEEAVERGADRSRLSSILALASAIAGHQRPPLSAETNLRELMAAGRYEDFEDRMASLLERHPHWRGGWNLLCTVLQLQGKDHEKALRHTLELSPAEGSAPLEDGKIFCIGANKTGTTSVEAVFRRLGLTVGDQEQAELLLHDWAAGDYRRLVAYCRSARAFQDIPFSLKQTYKALDAAFPDARFILTVRRDADEWYESLVRYHTQIVGKGRIPTATDLRQFNYRYPGFLLDALRLSYGADGCEPYDRNAYIRYYESHNAAVREHFESRPDRLLVVNIAEPDAMERLVTFLGFPFGGEEMPHLNPSAG